MHAMDQRFIDRVYESLAFEHSREGPPDDFPALPPIPGGRYTDPEFLKLEQKFLWGRSWLYACHGDEIPRAGSYLLWNRSGSSILIVRGEDNRIRAFYNTCRHRGGPVVRDASGQAKDSFTCGYHGWTYDLEGRLKGMRDRRDFVDLDFEDLCLVPVRCESLGNWLFINEDPQAEPLLDSLGPIAAQMQQFDLENIRHIDTHGFEVECNVKVLLDAFLEVYHLGSIHQHTVNRFLDHRGTSIILWPRGHSLMVTPNRNPDWVDPGTRGMIEFQGVTELPRKTNVSYNIFPNLITPVAATGLPFLNFWPTGERSMYVECHWFSPDWGDGHRHELWDQRIENFDRILAEDTQFAPKIQKSVESKGFKGIKLNYQERRIYHWHEELDRCIGIDRIPQNLRVSPRLSGLVEGWGD